MTIPSAIGLTADLIRCPSVTPEEGGALALLERVLQPAGFSCTRISRGGVENLYARWGRAAPVFGFGGHTDVVPVGNRDAWRADPFGAEIRDGVLWGRGATDMKSGVGAFVAAAIRLVTETPPDGSVALVITGDEEGPATDGTIAVLDWMRQNGETLDICIVGEPTSVARLGDVVKIGRRGSMNGTLNVRGKQGHTAYPKRAINPLPVLSRICAALSDTRLDEGSEHFQASTLALASIDVGNPVANVIPAEGKAVFNIRFNDLHSSDSIKAWVDRIVAQGVAGSGCEVEIAWKVSGESFLTHPGQLTELIGAVVAERCGAPPAMTTGGGTSDARFIKDMCPVVELGLVGDTMHQVDERVPVADIDALSALYLDLMRRYFA
ncbi:MAG: succinyl-diaminopimelate desuccinylase [Pseudomonadota bacterium]